MNQQQRDRDPVRLPYHCVYNSGVSGRRVAKKRRLQNSRQILSSSAQQPQEVFKIFWYVIWLKEAEAFLAYSDSQNHVARAWYRMWK